MGIKWGMIGCGNVAEIKSGPSLSMIKDSSLEMVMSNDPDEAKNFARRHQIARWTSEADELINDPEVSAIYVATPPNSHAEYTKKAALAGKPVLTEKPMACNLADAEAMTEACLKAGVPLFVAYYRRGLPRYHAIKKTLEGGKIGVPLTFSIFHTLPPEDHPVAPVTKKDIKENTIPWRFLPKINGGGNFIDMGTHTIDMIDFLIAPFIRSDGLATNVGGLYPAEDRVSGSFTLTNGVEGVGQWCYASGVNIDRTEIIGTKGRIVYSCFNNDPVVIETKGNIETIDEPLPDHTHIPLIQSVIDELIGKGICVSNYENGLRAMHVQERLLAKYYNREMPDPPKILDNAN